MEGQKNTKKAGGRRGSMRYREALALAAERRRVKDEAARLRVELPELEALRLRFAETDPSLPEGCREHVRHVVIDQAPALFVLPCSDRRCEGSGHDLTQAIMKSLRAGAATFEGADPCAGQVAGRTCGRLLTYSGQATYRRP